MEDLGKEVDEYFAKKYPLETKKILCHQCGGAVDNSLQQLKAEIAAIVCEMDNCQPSLYSVYWSEYVNKLRQLSAV